MRLEGKVAFISGGARGMGAVEARLFAREGAKISIGDLLEEEGRRVEAEINGAGGNCLFVHLDVTNEANWQRAIVATVDRFGKLDILVNNAGVGSRGRLHETTIEEWNQVMDINATGTFLGTKAAIPEMQKAGAGSIINISSGAGNVGVHFVGPAYHASKAAVRLLAKATAVQYAKDGIRVNSVHPGPIATPMTARRTDPTENEQFMSLVPLGRWGEPEEVAYGVLYLASDESLYVTGAELAIDGGVTAQ